MSEQSTDRIAFIGLGTMGSRMSRRLVEAGFEVIGFDPVEAARADLVAAGGRAAATPTEAITGADYVILMLPSSLVVESVLDDAALLDALKPGIAVIDMSSSEPESTRKLSGALTERKLTLVDAPVSGGVRGAETGTLTIMAGGPDEAITAVRPILAPLGTVRHVGGTGAGHAVKAINNLLAATNLLAAAEGVAAGRRFGVDPSVIIETINTASGRSAATQLKFPQNILPATYDSGFALALMLKDMRIATDLARSVGAPATLGEQAVELWSRAAADLDPAADQTDIARWVDRPRNS
ncbi:NAD(P)-dependent oxidoreductase [Nocardia jiangxiensis]|uniref:NAD(P)-dependent oxidoreductase n=1 Tax=Nocardia jiangxiensis TaxID=282685 RepID=A0ABW6S130_9NOCA|nr:NAD(P)-dependent oxidoreductase [Nocardia jiangxiensis]